VKSLVARAAILALAVGFGVGRVRADTVTFQFTGTVTGVDPAGIEAIGGTDVVAVGDKVTGTATYDLDSPGTAGGTVMFYGSPVPPGNMTYSVGGFSFTTGPGTEGFGVVVGNATPSNLQGGDSVDAFVVGSGDVQVVGGDPSPAIIQSVLRLEDTTQSVFNDTSLPASLNLSAFDLGNLEVFEIEGMVAFRVFQASIDTIAGLPIVNDLVTLGPVTTSFNPAVIPGFAPAGTFHIEASFTNTSSTPIQHPIIRVTELSGGNTLINGLAGGSGFVLIPDAGPDGMLSPNESFTADFLIGLQFRKPFIFEVDLVGSPSP
jgi:hypothetical protein